MGERAQGRPAECGWVMLSGIVLRCQPTADPWFRGQRWSLDERPRNEGDANAMRIRDLRLLKVCGENGTGEAALR